MKPTRSASSEVAAAVLLLLAATALVARLGRESALWMDELYTLALVHREPADILDLTADDFNPPGYYLALKAWLKTARLAGLEPGLLWARGLNLVPWILLTALCVRVSRRRGSIALGLMPLVIAGGAAMTEMARHLRGYAAAAPALAIAWLCLTTVGRSTGRTVARERGLWVAYVAASLVAVWSHALSMVMVSLFAAAWAALVFLEKQSAEQWRRGLVAHVLIAFGALPWLIPAMQQLGRLRAADPSWMTPATSENLLRAFVFWLPFGGLGAASGQAWLLLLGALSVGLPLGLAAAALGRPSRAGGGSGDDPETGWLRGLLGFAVAALFVWLLWALARADVVEVFHGPRYPLLASGIWAVALVELSQAGLRRLGRSPGLAWLTLAPWILCGVIGTWSSLGAAGPGSELARLRVPASAHLYVMPSELLPFVRDSLARHEPAPIDALPTAEPNTAIAVLDLNRWGSIDRPRDLLARHWIEGGRLSDAQRSRRFPARSSEFGLTLLSRPLASGLSELRRHGLRPTRRAPDDALAVATAESQRFADGWSFIEVAEDLGFRRWSREENVRLRFDRVVEAGSHLLTLDGYRTDRPTAIVELEVRVDGRILPPVRLPAGRIHVEMPVELEASRVPRIELSHPLWSPADGGSSDDRQLGLQLRSAWITRARPETSGIKAETGSP